MWDLLINGLVLFGSFFVFVAALGVWRLPDFYTRMHAATKAGAFGGGVLALAVGLGLLSANALIQAVLVVCFFYITTPVAGHLLGRVAYLRKVYFYEKPNE